MSLYKDLVNTSLHHKDINAIYYHNRFYSYRQFIKKVDFYSDFFANVMNFHQGMVISLCLENSFNSFALIYALNKIGVIMNLINPRLPIDQIMFFDSVVHSRIFILENQLYQKFYDELVNKRAKIAVFDNEKFSLPKAFRKIKYRKQEDAGIPINFKLKAEKTKFDNLIYDKTMAITAPNERFEEKPSVSCFTNQNLHQSLLNEQEIYEGLGKGNVALIYGNIMSYSMLMTFFHPMLCSGICVCLDNHDDKHIKKVARRAKFTLLAGDETSIKSIINADEHKLVRLFKHLTKAFVYNDVNRTYIYEKWCDLCALFNKNVEIVSLLGTVETSGAILQKILSDDSFMCYGEFIGDFKPFVDKVLKTSPVGPLYVKSKAIMIGYYKQTDKNDESLTLHGLKTGYRGTVDEYGKFHLLTSTIKKQSFTHNSPYFFNLEEMIMTIPGIKKVNITISLEYDDVVECLVDADKKETMRITTQVASYLDAQFKGKNIDYKIVFKD